MPTPDKLPGIIQNQITGQDILIVNDGGQTKKITLAMLSQYLGTAGVEGSHILNIVFTSSTGGDEPGIPGATDTYTITFREEDGTEGTATFEVHNGADGTNGQQGAPGDPIDDVQAVGTPTLGQPTVLRFFIDGEQVGSDITVQAGQQGETGAGFTGGSYSSSTGEVTFTSADGLGFSTGDLRGAASTEAGPQGAYYVKAFTRNANRPDRPTDLTWVPANDGTLSGADAAPTGDWSTEIPTGTAQTWEVQAFFDPSQDTDITVWSSVFQAGAEGQKGDDGENLKVEGYNSDNLGTTVSLETAITEEPAGTFFVRHGEQGEDGPKGDQGDPGAPVDNVVVDHSAGPGGTTIIHFEVEDVQIGSQINIPPGERGATGQTGQTGETGESIEVPIGGYSIDGNNNTTVTLVGKESGDPAGSFLVNGGQQGLTGPGYDNVTVISTDENGTLVEFIGTNGADDEEITIPRGQQGVQGVYQVQVFQVFGDTAPAKPVGGVWNATSRTWTTLPAGWVAEPALDTTGTHVWESFAIFDPANPTATFVWSTPFIAGAQGPAGNTGVHGTNVNAVYTPSTEQLTVTETTFNADGSSNTPTTIVDAVKIVGDTGANATLVGDGVAGVTTVPNKGDGSVGDATVTQSGDAQNIDFTFGIPQGIQGTQGDAVDGVTQSPPNPGAGIPSTLSFTANGQPVTGTVNLPAGGIGQTGQAAGFGAITAAPVDPVDATTLGTPTVTAGGTNAAQTLAFGIPTGLTGQQGNQGLYNITVYATASPTQVASLSVLNISTSSGLPSGGNLPTSTLDTTGNTGGTILTQWSATPTNPTGSNVVIVTNATYDPSNPTGTITWGNPYEASGVGATGPQGIQGPIGPNGLSIGLVDQIPLNPGPGDETLLRFRLSNNQTIGNIITLPAGQNGPQGLYNVFIFRVADTDAAPSSLQPTDGTGIATAPTGWSFDPIATEPTAPNVIWLTSGLYDPGDPTATINWGLPFKASGSQGPPGPAGIGFKSGGDAGDITVKATNNDYDTKWVSFTTGYDATHQQIGFSSNGGNIAASVDLTGYTPLNPSGGSGHPTTSKAFTGTRADAPTAFIPNTGDAGGDLTASVADASDAQHFEFTYGNISGDGSDDWAIINLPIQLTDGLTVGFNFRDPQSGLILPVKQSTIVVEVEGGGSPTYTTYSMSFGRNVEIITHITS